jgi:transglutaminase-like putative cysteine protease
MALPMDEPGRQTVTGLRLHPPGARVLREHGRPVAEWWLKGTAAARSATFSWSATVAIQPWDAATARRRPATAPALPPAERARLSTAQPMIEADDPAIRTFAAEVSAGTDDLDTAIALCRAVGGRLRYGGFDPEDHGAARTMATGQADCSGYADLLAAACRARGIPARVRLAIVDTRDTTPLHALVEVHAGGMGWVPLDPLWSAQSGMAPERLPVRAVLLNHERQDPSLFGQRSDHAFLHWSATPPPAPAGRLNWADLDRPGAPVRRFAW